VNEQIEAAIRSEAGVLALCSVTGRFLGSVCR